MVLILIFHVEHQCSRLNKLKGEKLGVGNEVWGWGGKEGREEGRVGGGGRSEEDKMMALM